MDCFGGEKVRCRCNSSICSRYLGVRPKVPGCLLLCWFNHSKVTL